jgi:nitronate monooxygenase
MNDGSGKERPKAWRDIRSAGQGTGAVTQIEPAADVIALMRCEFREAREEFCRTPAK